MTVSFSATLAVGMMVSGVGIQANTVITQVVDGTHVALSNPALASSVLEYGVSGTRAFAKVKLSRSAEGADILADIEDGIRCNISVGYVVHEMQPLDEEGDQTTYLVTRWEPLEISLVSVPADATVGIGRSAERKSNVRSKQGSDSEAVFELAILRGVPGLDAAWLKAFPSGTPEDFLKAIGARARKLDELFENNAIR